MNFCSQDANFANADSFGRAPPRNLLPVHIITSPQICTPRLFPTKIFNRNKKKRLCTFSFPNCRYETQNQHYVLQRAKANTAVGLFCFEKPLESVAGRGTLPGGFDTSSSIWPLNKFSHQEPFHYMKIFKRHLHSSPHCRLMFSLEKVIRCHRAGFAFLVLFIANMSFYAVKCFWELSILKKVYFLSGAIFWRICCTSSIIAQAS